MSKAFKCDRCNTCFDPYAVDDSSYFIHIGEVVYQNGQEFSDCKCGYRSVGQHLCPDCSRKYSDFMKLNKNEDDELSIEEIADAFAKADSIINNLQAENMILKKMMLDFILDRITIAHNKEEKKSDEKPAEPIENSNIASFKKEILDAVDCAFAADGDLELGRDSDSEDNHPKRQSRSKKKSDDRSQV